MVIDLEKGGEVFFRARRVRWFWPLIRALAENLERSVFDFKQTPQGRGVHSGRVLICITPGIDSCETLT